MSPDTAFKDLSGEEPKQLRRTSDLSLPKFAPAKWRATQRVGSERTQKKQGAETNQGDEQLCPYHFFYRTIRRRRTKMPAINKITMSAASPNHNKRVVAFEAADERAGNFTTMEFPAWSTART